ncbi:hypothetical protein [Pseudomonas veronii]
MIYLDETPALDRIRIRIRIRIRGMLAVKLELDAGRKARRLGRWP